MATKDQIDVGKVRKEATKKSEIPLKDLNKNLPSITEDSMAGAGTANSNLLATMSEKQTQMQCFNATTHHGILKRNCHRSVLNSGVSIWLKIDIDSKSSSAKKLNHQ